MKLYPAHPNPFNPTATIRFYIAKNYQTNTLLNIYDISGRIRKGPAPTNMEIPKYEFVNANTIKIG